MAQDPRGTTQQYVTAAVDDAGVILAGPGRVYKIWGINNNAAVRYIQLFDSLTVPADTAVPKVTVRVALTSQFELDLGELGWFFPTGIAWANSSTLGTKTVGAEDTWLNCIFKKAG